MIDIHRDKYSEASEEIDRKTYNIDEILEITEYLKSNKIECYKYNSCLDEIVQNFCSYDAIFEL